MTEKSNLPLIRFKGFTSPWEQRKLGELGKTFTGLSGKTSSDFGHGKAKYITYMNVFQNPIASKSATEPIEIDNRQNKVKYGDIFFTTSSETPEEVGMSSIWLENTENTYLNSFCFGYRLNNNEKINLQFLAYLLRASNFRSNMMLLAQGISRYNISKNKVIEINISLPIEIDEQNKIGQLFSNLDNLITLHQRKYEKLLKVKKSLLEKMFSSGDENVPKLRFKGFTSTWEQRKLGDLVARFATGLNPRDNFTLNNGGKNYYVTIKNFTHGNLVLDENCDKIDDAALAMIQERSDLHIGDILFSSIGRVGDCFLIENEPTNWNINESVFVLRPVKGIVDPPYLMNTIHSDHVLSVILSCVTGSTFKSIKMAQLKEISLPYPSMSEQMRIGRFITTIDNLITLHQRKLEKLKNIKKSLLEKMFA